MLPMLIIGDNIEIIDHSNSEGMQLQALLKMLFKQCCVRFKNEGFRSISFQYRKSLMMKKREGVFSRSLGWCEFGLIQTRMGLCI